MALGIQLNAQKPQATRPFEISVTVEEPWDMLQDLRMSRWSGKALAMYNLRERVQSTDPEAAARLFLKANRELLGLADETLSDLSLRHIRTSLAGTTLRFAQSFHGVPVYDSEITLNISPDGYVTFVMNGYKAVPALMDVNPAVAEESARESAITRIGLVGPMQFDQTHLVIFRQNTTTRLAWNVRMVGESPIGDWDALVDAQTGEIFKLQDVSCYYHDHKVALRKGDEGHPQQAAVDSMAPAPLPLPPAQVNGLGNTFDADPLSSAAATYNVGGYTDGTDANAAVLTAQLQNKTLQQITSNAGVVSLIGPYAEIMDFEAPNKGLFTQATTTFNFDRNADNFEAVNTYFHLDQSLRYINQTLGITLMPFQYATGMRFDPSGLSGADNSHYIGSTGRIAFGEGGVDDAEDSDVILHELGHGLHDWATNGSLSQVNGLSEGCGDYWAQSYSRSKGQWTTVQAPYQWVFNWDGHNPFWGGRITNYGALYPGGLVNQIHTDGQIWATCLMKIYDVIGRTKTDMAFLEGLMLTNSTTNQQDAAIAFRQAGINMGYTMTELTQITNFFTGCGYIMPPFPVLYNSFTGQRLNSQYVDLNWETASSHKTTALTSSAA
ncbi:MAG: peptidase [Bacteroidia bacterium]